MSNYALLESILNNGIEYIVAVPCQEFSELLLLIQKEEQLKIIFPQREDEGVGILLGLAVSGKKTLGIFQDTLLGNSQNVMGFIISSCRIGLPLWVGSRKDEFLKRNIVHEYITSNVPYLCQDSNINLNKVYFSDFECLGIKSKAFEFVSESLTAESQSINILQVVF